MAICSMTGFGEASHADGGLKISIEIKSVNHRFVDTVFRLPSVYSRFEAELQKLAQSKLRRGRVEIFVNRKRSEGAATALQFNAPLFQSYAVQIKEALHQAGCGQPAVDQALAQVLSRREVLDSVAADEEVSTELPLLQQTFAEALDKLLESRKREGAELEREILNLLQSVEDTVASIRSSSEAAPETLKTKLLARIQKISPEVQIDPARFAQEAAYLSERVDITEELTRLGSHCGLFRQTLGANDGGRKLEFVLQEMGREVNTIGSKTQDASVSALVVEGKSLLEKIREQTANIE